MVALLRVLEVEKRAGPRPEPGDGRCQFGGSVSRPMKNAKMVNVIRD